MFFDFVECGIAQKMKSPYYCLKRIILGLKRLNSLLTELFEVISSEGRCGTVLEGVGRCGHDDGRSVTLGHDDLKTVTGW